jgi:hypothetical protein
LSFLVEIAAKYHLEYIGMENAYSPEVLQFMAKYGFEKITNPLWDYHWKISIKDLSQKLQLRFDDSTPPINN